MNLPSPESQLAFLAKLQRLFAEGDFTATYKFALLISLADLAVECGRDDGGPLRLTTRQIAEKFVELYWQQSLPYFAGSRPMGVLVQSTGSQAAVITAIMRFRNSTGCSTLQAARSSPRFARLIGDVAATVSAQPLTFLQNLGGQSDPFLYERERGAVVLKPGVAYCLRRFQPLVQQLARTHWVGHVKHNRLNHPILGAADDLEAFLFETPRQALVMIGDGLRRLSSGHCFYCKKKQQNTDVDHFVPFSLYPRDLMHNFVLACKACNGSKSDTLAARLHLENWIDYISKHDDDLREIGDQAGRIADLDKSRAVARWGYSNAASINAQGWVRVKEYEIIDSSYTDCLA